MDQAIVLRSLFMADSKIRRRKFIINTVNAAFALAMLGITGLGLILVTYLMRPISNCRKNICGYYAEGKNSLDMVYIGSSAAYYGWEPLRGFHERGFTSYNFGTDALQAQSIKYEVREIMKTQKPELLLIELRPFIYGAHVSEVDGLINIDRVAPFRNVSDNLKYSLNRYNYIHEAAPSGAPEWTYQFDLSMYHTLLSELVSKENWTYLLNQKHLYSKGFFYHNEIRYVELNMPEDMEAREAIDDKVNGYLLDLLTMLKSECPDTKVCFVLMPYGAYDKEYANANYIMDEVKDYGYDVFNGMLYADEMELLGSEDFRDSDHMNLGGANKFSYYFADYLAENYNLPDHRNDSDYDTWYEDYNTWASEVDNVELLWCEY